MRGASLADWRSLLTFTTAAKSTLFMYDLQSLSCMPLSNAIPWPVIWLLCTRNKKHIFINNTKPPLERLRDDLIDFSNRAKWKWCLRNSDPTPRVVKYKSSLRSPTCTKIVDPDLQAWLTNLRSKVLSKGSSMLRSSSSRPWSNLLGLERLALRLFRSLPFVLLPNDKGPGFSFMDVATFAAVEQSVSSNASYIGIHRCDIPVESTMRACAAAARRVEAYLGLDGAAAQINRSLTRGTLFARLGLTVKSHKEPGSMTCRNLHKMPSYQLEGLAKWVGAQLASKLNVPHIMTDSFAVKRSLHGMQVPAGAVLATLDLKDFFMSGPIFDLIADCVFFFDGPLAFSLARFCAFCWITNTLCYLMVCNFSSALLAPAWGYHTLAWWPTSASSKGLKLLLSLLSASRAILYCVTYATLMISFVFTMTVACSRSLCKT